jgi:hypothetical protein
MCETQQQQQQQQQVPGLLSGKQQAGGRDKTRPCYAWAAGVPAACVSDCIWEQQVMPYTWLVRLNAAGSMHVEIQCSCMLVSVYGANANE